MRLNLDGAFRPKERVIIIKNGKIVETRNFLRKRDFIVAFGRPYPLSSVKILDDFRGGKVYVIIEDNIPAPDLEKLERLVKREEVYNITKALLWYTSQPTKTLIAIGAAALFAGAYLKYLADGILDWLRSLPPDVAAKGFSTLGMLSQAAMIVGLLAFFWWQRRGK